MVSKEELIYHFTDIYLSTALECSICRENFDMVDDKEFLDDYLKLFSVLLIMIQEHEEITVEGIKEFLEEKAEGVYRNFFFFMKRKIAAEALEIIGTRLESKMNSEYEENEFYGQEIKKYMDAVFDKGISSAKMDPISLLKEIRKNEEDYRIAGEKYDA